MRSARETGRAARRAPRSEQETASSSPTKLVVAAIDFGTKYSACAYSFHSFFKTDPLHIYAYDAWNRGIGEGFISDRTPATILFMPDESFHSFGYDAETKYEELTEDDNHTDWYYFSRFNMKLRGQTKIRREMNLKDDLGHQMSAMKVFSEAIKYVQTRLLKSLLEKVPDTRSTDIHWVITVPAIWDDGSKQFMRDAGNEAGIPNNQLDLALEPEAAAIYCKAVFVETDGPCIEAGTQFMLADLGGETADITIHEVGESGNITALSPTSGGPWGEEKVDAAFDTLLENVYGKHIVSSLNQNRKADALDLKREFYRIKRKFDGEDKVIFRGMAALTETLKETGQTLEQKLSGTIYEGKVVQIRDKVHIPASFMSELFEDVKKNIIQHMREVMIKHPEVNVVLMVGEFSESNVIKKAVHKAFPFKMVIIPQDTRLAMVKGAVVYGHESSFIISRSIPFTYGISVNVPFKNWHLEPKKVYIGGACRCKDIFKVFILAGERIIPGKTTIHHVCSASTLTSAKVEIYRTKSKFPMYVDDPGCANIGSIYVRNSELRPIQITMFFGSNELSVQVKEDRKNNDVVAKLNFLH